MRGNTVPIRLGAVLLPLLATTPGFVWAQQGPIKIGFITSLTGTAAQAARDMVNGLQMYLDEIGSQMAGRKVELIVEDDQSQPTTAITKLRKPVDHDRGPPVPGLP